MNTEPVQLQNFRQQRNSILSDVSIATRQLESLRIEIINEKSVFDKQVSSHEEELLRLEEALWRTRRTTDQIKSECLSALKEIELEKSLLQKASSSIKKSFLELDVKKSEVERFYLSLKGRSDDLKSLIEKQVDALDKLRTQTAEATSSLDYVVSLVSKANESLSESQAKERVVLALASFANQEVEKLKKDQERLNFIKVDNEGRALTLSKKEANFDILVRRLQKKYNEVYPDIKLSLE